MTRQKLERAKEIDEQLTELSKYLSIIRKVDRISLHSHETGFLRGIDLDAKSDVLFELVVQFKEDMILELEKREQELANEFDNL